MEKCEERSGAVDTSLSSGSSLQSSFSLPVPNLSQFPWQMSCTISVTGLQRETKGNITDEVGKLQISVLICKCIQEGAPKIIAAIYSMDGKFLYCTVVFTRIWMPHMHWHTCMPWWQQNYLSLNYNSRPNIKACWDIQSSRHTTWNKLCPANDKMPSNSVIKCTFVTTKHVMQFEFD